jgi:predicted RNase H-like nuclease (RuvC/YqgF family)
LRVQEASDEHTAQLQQDLQTRQHHVQRIEDEKEELLAEVTGLKDAIAVVESKLCTTEQAREVQQAADAATIHQLQSQIDEMTVSLHNATTRDQELQEHLDLVSVHMLQCRMSSSS